MFYQNISTDASEVLLQSFFWKLLKVFKAFVPSFFLCEVRLCCLIFLAQEAWAVCDELRLFFLILSDWQSATFSQSTWKSCSCSWKNALVWRSTRELMALGLIWVGLFVSCSFQWALVLGPQITTWQSKLQKDFCIPWGKIWGCWKSGTVSLCFFRYWSESGLIF